MSSSFKRGLLLCGSILFAGWSSLPGLAADPDNRWHGQFVEPGFPTAGSALAVDGAHVYAAAGALRRWDGHGWVEVGVPVDGIITVAVRAPDGLYVGGNFSRIDQVVANNVAKWTGTEWKALGDGVNGVVLAMAVFGNSVYVAGDFQRAGNQEARFVARWEHERWHPLGQGPDNGVGSTVETLAVDDSGRLFAGGFFAEAGGQPADGLAQWDGTAWSALGESLVLEDPNGTFPGRVLALAAWQGALYVGGQFSHAGELPVSHLARWQAGTWSAVDGGVTEMSGGSGGQVSALLATPDGLFVAGEFHQAGSSPATGLARWDGVAWHGLIQEGFPLPRIHRLAAAESGDIYLVGGFTSIGEANTGMGIGRYRDGRFHAIGNGVSHDVFALHVRNDTVVAGGRFFYAGGVFLGNIGRWTGREWMPLGGGVDGIVRTVAIHPNGDIFAGGDFSKAGGVEARGLARWDGQSWSAVGGGLHGPNPRALALHFVGDTLYVGGAFTRAGDVDARSVARWDGTTWSTLGDTPENGVDGSVFALTGLGDHIFVGGQFSEAGGQLTDALAAWNLSDSSWSGLPGLRGYASSPPTVQALTVLGAELILGGRFTFGPNTTETLHVARWDGTGFEPLGGNPANGVLGFVDALAVDGADLYVGGQFEVAGGVAVQGITRFDGQSFQPLGSGTLGRVYTLGIHESFLLAGGTFTRMGNKSSVGFAQWTVVDELPGVALSQPEDGAHYVAGTPIPMESELLHGLSDVARVEFYQGLTRLQTLADPPYQFEWTLAFPGDHLLSTRAVRSQGETFHSAPVRVTVEPSPDNLVPVVEWIAPTNHTVIDSDQTVVMHASATDIDGTVERVEFYVDDIRVATRNDPPYQVTLQDLPLGSRLLFARAYDDAGAWADSTPVTLIVEPPNLPPILEFISPRGPTYELPTVPVFLARASDYDGFLASVQFFADDTLLATFPQNSGDDDFYRFAWTDATPGVYVPRAQATDNRGAISLRTFDPIHVLPPNLRPIVAIVDPAESVALTGPVQPVVTVEASDPDGSVVAVRLFVGETQVASRTAEPFEFELPSLADGRYCLRAEAEDDRGGVSVSQPVCLSITTPALRYRVDDLGAMLQTRESRANALNRQGQVVGEGRRADFVSRAFVATTHSLFGEEQQFLPSPQPIPPEAGPEHAWADGINDVGQIVGGAVGLDGKVRAFLFEDGQALDLGTLADGEGESHATDINNHGTIVGMSRTADGSTQAFVHRDGQMLPLAEPEFHSSRAEAINEAGQIVGFVHELSGGFSAFRYDPALPDEGLIWLETFDPAFGHSRALDINEAGQIVGRVENHAGLSRAFLHQNGAMQDLGTLGGILSSAQAINQHGTIVGHSRDYDNEPHACLWQDGQIYDLNHLIPPGSGWRLQEALDINDCGQIVGYGNRAGSDDRHAFLLTPLPEPVPLAPLALNRQTGLFEQTVRLAITGPGPLCVVRLRIDGLPGDVHALNALTLEGVSYVEHIETLDAGTVLDLVIEFFIPNRREIDQPVYTVDTARPGSVPIPADAPPFISRTVLLPSGAALVEFATQLGRTYEIQYSPDGSQWRAAVPRVAGTGTRIQWIDQGPPKTVSRPDAQPARFYRVILLPEGTVND
jgi:trimeric autotransporter adhesin